MLTFTFLGCGGDDDQPQIQPIPVFNGTHESIEAYVTPELLETMERFGSSNQRWQYTTGHQRRISRLGKCFTGQQYRR
jgi:hypothetical protein